MPPVIIAAVAVIAGTTIAAYVALAFAVVSAMDNARKAKRARKQAIADFNASLQDRLISQSVSNGPRSRVYGRVRNSDCVIFKGTHGVNSQFYTLVVALAGHEIEGIETVYFDDVPLDLLSDGTSVGGGAGVGFWATNSPFSRTERRSSGGSFVVAGGVGSALLPFTPLPGSVSATITLGEDTFVVAPLITGNTISVSGQPNGTWTYTYQYDFIIRRARMWKYLGAPGQDMSVLLASRFPALLSAFDKFQGVGALVVELEYDQGVFPTGVPQITAVIKGAKVFDPRNSTTAWTENPALIARDWALNPNGGGCASDEIIDAQFIAAANACDVSTVFNTTAGNETRPLYQCGIVCSTGASPAEVFEEIVESMAGEWGWSSGRLAVVAGVYRSPVAAIDDTWLSERDDLVVSKDPPRNEVVNVYRPVIANADGYVDGVTGTRTSIAYTATPAPEVRSAAFIAADGQELAREIGLTGVTRVVHAQHICGVLMRKARDGMIVQLPCNLRAFTLELFDTVTLTLSYFGFAAKEFEVIGWKFGTEEGVTLTLKETTASIYSPSSGLSVLDAAQNTTLPIPWNVPSVTGLTVTSGTPTLQDGWPVTRVRVTWNAVVEQNIRQSGRIEIQYVQSANMPTDGRDWASWFEQGTATEALIPGLKANTTYVFRIRAINTLGVAGPWSLQNGHIVTDPPLIDTPVIAPEAATTTMSAYSETGSFTYVGPGNFFSRICVINWTNTSTESLTLQIEWSAEIAGIAGSTLKNVDATFRFQSSLPPFVSAGNSTATDASKVSIAKVMQRVVDPGSTVLVCLDMNSINASYPVFWNVAQTRLTVIKR